MLLTLDPNILSRENSVVQKALPNSVFTSSVIHTQMPLPRSSLSSHLLAPILPHMLRYSFPSDVVFASSQSTLSFSAVQSPILFSSIFNTAVVLICWGTQVRVPQNRGPLTVAKCSMPQTNNTAFQEPNLT